MILMRTKLTGGVEFQCPKCKKWLGRDAVLIHKDNFICQDCHTEELEGCYKILREEVEEEEM